ncbi:MAG: thiamine biosynthesis protein ThiS [Desulfobacterales bacterium]|nr:MoaD/ThiS family protein [Pseudomonadota bacterium]MCG2777181.1 thiamine biosynthesis protein ThiS [Desulfobacterales bacterium]
MVSSENRHTVNISLFGFLRRYMDEQGLPYTLEREIARQGEAAFDLARELSLPPEKIEAVFCNGRVINIYDTVFPGDRVAFFPFGTPGPYRVFLGIARENIERTRREKKAVDVEKGK